MGGQGGNSLPFFNDLCSDDGCSGVRSRRGLRCVPRGRCPHREFDAVMRRRWVRRIGRVMCLRAAVMLALTPAASFGGFVQPARAQTVDTAVPSVLEDLVSYKLAAEGTALTATQSSAMPALFESGVSALIAEEAAAAPAAIVAGPIGWLGLAAGLGLLAAASFANYQGAANSALPISCQSATVCNNTGTRTLGPNLTSGNTVYKINSGNLVGVGSDMETALAEAIANNNGKGGTQYQEAQSCSVAQNECFVEQVPAKGSTTTPSVSYVAVNSISPTPTISVGYPAAANYVPASGSTPASYTNPNTPAPQVKNDNLQNTTSSNLSQQQQQAAANPQALADLANNVWQQAAKSNSSFPAPSVSDPITAADVVNMLKANTIASPAIVDMAAPAATVTPESGGKIAASDTAPTTWPTPAQVSNTSTGTGTTSTGTTSSQPQLPPCGNLAAGEPSCEVDWGAAPTLSQPDPTMPVQDTGFLAPFFNMLPRLSAYQVPTHTAACTLPTITSSAFNGAFGTISPTGICDFLGRAAPTLQGISLAGWTLSALFTLLAA